MSRATSWITAHRKLWQAGHRHGVGPVFAFLISSLHRYGPVEALRLATGDRTQRLQAAETYITRPPSKPLKTLRLYRIGLLIAAPWRLVRAMQRHGVASVAAFLILSLRRHGLTNSLRLATADRSARFKSEERNLIPLATTEQRRGDDDLDGEYSLPAAAWSRWLPWVGARQPPSDPYEDSFETPLLTYLVCGTAHRSADPAFSRTKSAIADGPPAKIIEWRGDASLQSKPDFKETFVVVLKAGDKPSPCLPREIGYEARNGVAEVVTFDMYRQDESGVHPILLPGANPTLLKSADYIFGRAALRGGAAKEIWNEPDARAAILRWLGERPHQQTLGRWRHVGQPLLEAAITLDDIANERATARCSARRPRKRPTLGSVCVVISTKNKGHLLRQLVNGLLEKADSDAKVVIVANNTSNAYALETQEDLEKNTRVRLLRYAGSFNFSVQSNMGAREFPESSHILFLNDDITPIVPDWLDRLLARFDDDQVGSAGPLLLYPDERVQHAGMYLGFNGKAGHLLRGASLPEEDYLLTAVAAREVSALTGAVLLVARHVFDAIGGFDEQLPTYLQDVDLCLRMKGSGFINVFEPAAILLHMESASIRAMERQTKFHHLRELEYSRFADRWGDAIFTDPYHPAGFDIQDETLHRLSGLRGRRPLLKDGLPIGL